MFVLSILFPLFLTLVIEAGIYMILRHRDLKLFIVVSIMNLVLNTTMNILLIQLGTTPINYWVILGVGEVMTTLIESLIVYLFMRFKYLKILLFAVIANATSFLVGLILEPLYAFQAILIVVLIVLILTYLAMYFIVLIPFIKKNRSVES